MLEGLLKAIKIMGSQRILAEAIGTSPKVVNAWLNKGIGIPLHYALEIERVTEEKVTWQELAPNLAARYGKRHWSSYSLGNSHLQALYVSLSRIQYTARVSISTPAIQFLAEDIQSHGLQHPICVDTDNVLIFGEKRLHAYEVLGKKTIPAWRLSLPNLAKGQYSKEELCQMFVLSERMAISLAFGKWLGNRQGQRSDLSLRQNFVQVKGRTDAFIADLFSFGNRQSYRQAKKVYGCGCQALIEAMDKKELAISAAALLAPLSLEHQEHILTWDSREILALVRRLRRNPALDFSTLTIPALEEV